MEPMSTLDARLLEGEPLGKEVVRRMREARESVWIATANVKAMMLESDDGRFRPITELFAQLVKRGVEVRLLHAELPSRPFRKAFDERPSLLRAEMTLKICPRVHFKCVRVDGAWLYLGSANLTGAGLGAKHADSRNFEVGFVTEDFETLDRISALYEQVWSGVCCRTCRFHARCPDPIGPGPSRGKGRPSTGGSDVVLGRTRRLRR
jgi:phosphatidylserine/phosphatidylglycerophosphate/cardiolipin synthase-like enzyme